MKDFETRKTTKLQNFKVFSAKLNEKKME